MHGQQNIKRFKGVETTEMAQGRDELWACANNAKDLQDI